MKNTFNFNLGSVNVNIDGTPVNIENVNISVDSEMSVAEMTQSFGMLKSLIDELKSMTTSTVIVDEPKTIEEPKKVINQTWDLDNVWSVIQARSELAFPENGMAKISWKNENTNTIESVEFNFDEDKILMYVRKDTDSFWCYLYEDGSRSYCGIRNTMAKAIIETISDDDVRAIALDFFNKTIKK